MTTPRAARSCPTALLLLVACGASPPTTRAPTAAEVTALRAELLAMAERDQAVRRVDFAALDAAARREAFASWREVDAANTARLRAIVTEFGWPSRSMVGADGAHAAWLLLQHADRAPDFQAECLPVLTALARQGEVDPGDLAYLTDRVRVAQGRPQVYGTQYPPATDAAGNAVADADGRLRYLVPLVEDADGLAARRRAAGLEPWIEYERRMARLHGRDPVDRPRAAPAAADR